MSEFGTSPDSDSADRPASKPYRTRHLNRLDAALGEGPADQPAGHESQRVVGRYHLFERLGDGGMGEVFRAEQHSPIERVVALKLIRPGLDTPEIVRRFESERRALARMDHANIAKVLDAGADPVAGRPYFVMEYVPGLPITRYCDEHRLSNRQRLELILQVCDAVAHAHQQMIVHRDLKPSNILVRSNNGPSHAVVKVIDFGVAKALAPSSAAGAPATLLTEVGRIVGTLDYMSPEQARSAGSHDDVDTRSDIYSLGVLLYELLTGALPFDPQKLRSAGLSGIERMICDVDPPTPSTRLSSLGDAAGEIAQRRQTQPQELTRELKRELEWIPLKAMRKEPSQRYATVTELADDVRNYLSGRPLRAAPESRVYRARKFLRRNRVAVAVATLVTLLLVGGIAGTTWQARRAQRQRQLAEARFEDIRTLSSKFIFDIHGDVVKLPGSQAAADKLLAVALEYLQKLHAESTDDIKVLYDASIGYQRLGDLQGNQYSNNKGDVKAAVASYEKARDIALRGLTLKPDDVETRSALAGAEIKLGDMEMFRGKSDAALRRFRTAQELMERNSVAKPGDFRARANVLFARERVAGALADARGTAEALKMYDQNIELARRFAAAFPDNDEPRKLLATELQWAYGLRLQAGESDGALANAREALGVRQMLAAHDPNDVERQFNFAVAHQYVARVVSALGKHDEALEYQKRCLELVKALIQKDPENARVRGMLDNAQILFAEFSANAGHLDEATIAYEEAIAGARQAYERSPADRKAFRVLNMGLTSLADMLKKHRKYPEALARYREVSKLLSPIADAEPNNVAFVGGLAYAQSREGAILLESGDAQAALAPLKHAVEFDERLVAADPANAQIAWLLVDAKTQLGDALAKLRRTTDATEQYGRARELAVTLREKNLRAQDEISPESLDEKLRALSSVPATNSAGTTQPAKARE